MTLQQRFIQYCLTNNVLRFGDFTLKSGRRSPYFFNVGQFQTGSALRALGHYYAELLHTAGIQFDVLFGPAYKGIPLVVATAIAFATQYQREIPYCFNRKESKLHGEGGNLVGAELRGRVVIIDDVMTAGTAVRDSIALIQASRAELAAVVVLLDRQERGQSGVSATQEIARKFSVPVLSVAGLSDIVDYVKASTIGKFDQQAMMEYRREYGVD